MKLTLTSHKDDLDESSQIKLIINGVEQDLIRTYYSFKESKNPAFNKYTEKFDDRYSKTTELEFEIKEKTND